MALPYKHPVFVWVCGVLAVLFYPPLIIFYGLALAIFLENKKPFLIWGAVIILAFLALAIFSNSLFKFALGHIFFKSYTGSFFPRFNLLDVAPLPAIILAFFAVRKIFREKKWLFYQLGLGLFLWIFYTLTLQRIVIGHERALFFTSIIICIFSGFGQEEIKKYLPKLKYAQIAGLVFFLLFIPFYTQWETWRNLILTDPVAQADSIPMAPANNYLTQDDLRIFKNIENKKFFSAPWKGTVIGVATGNYPATTKGGTITMDSKNPGIYQKFMKAGCGEKINIAKERNVDYVYSMPFSCPEFIEKDRSSEGFVLYEYDR